MTRSSVRPPKRDPGQKATNVNTREVGMRQFRVVFAVLASLLVILSSACGGDSSPEATPPDGNAPETTTAAETQPGGTTAPEETTTGDESPEQPFEDFDYDNFDRPTNIDNAWLPLQPGTQLVLEGSTFEGGRRVAHRVVLTVTDLTKVIDSIPVVVAWERDYAADELVETELAFFAQDNDGNVWHFGQYPEEYENGEFVEAPAWIAGVENARAGIAMKADPQRGAPSYSQGWGPAVNWTDRAEVYRTDQRTCVPVDCYEGVLVMEEFSREEPDAFQLKYYARGVGNVRVGWRGDDPSKEELELVKAVQLSSEALAHIRAEALKMERRAYEISTEVYARTSPAEAP
jgi:hypothetical protein